MADAPARPEDFEAIYDLPDPRPYFRALAPLDYRMPAVVSGFLARFGGAIASARGKEGLEVIDFACGYGAIGLLLKHQIDLAGFYRHFAQDPGGPLPESDAAFFAGRRRSGDRIHLTGIDIAATALAYAAAVGALDAAFAANLLEEAPSPALTERLAAADLVIESGAIGDLLAPAMAAILGAGGAPWLLLAPRGDVDDAPLREVLAQRGYRVELCNQRPFRYRRFLHEKERRATLETATALGRAPEDRMDEAYFLIDLWLARPEADCRRHAIASFTADFTELDAP